MDEVIWIEILSRHREVTSRHRCQGPEVRIGRGYGNDVVIDDPYVAAQHLLVRRDETGALVAEDLGSANGTFAERGRARLKRLALDGEKPIRIGQTYLRIRAASYAVPQERVQTYQAPGWPIPAALAVAVLGIAMLSRWLGETGDPKLYVYLVEALILAGLVVGWTAVWAVLSRVFSGQARFERHLLIALAGLLIFSLYHEFLQLGAFALSSQAPQSYNYIGTWSLLAAICFLHLRAIDPSRTRLKGAAVAALLAIVVATQALTQSEIRSGNNQQDYVHRLMPPALRLAPLRDEDAFFAAAAQLRPGLDRDRTKDLPASGVGFLVDGGD
jgi:phosphatidylserine synthase